jgi:hypothetical protein
MLPNIKILAIYILPRVLNMFKYRELQPFPESKQVGQLPKE